MENKKNSLIGIVLAVVLLGSIGLFFTESCVATGARFYVKNSYPYANGDGSADRPYQSIQKAIDLASDGDSIYVFEGIYNETLQISKSVSIVGLDKRNTTIGIFGGSPRYLIQVTSDYVTLEDLNISDSMSRVRVALIYSTANYLTLQGLNIGNGTTWGVYLDSSTDNTIGYSVVDNIKGIYGSQSNNNVFTNNLFIGTTNGAVTLVNSQNNIIYNNTFKNCQYGVYAQNSNNVNISKNTIQNESYDGITLYGGMTHRITANTIENNAQNGLWMRSSNGYILENVFSNNQIGIMLDGSTNQVRSNIINDSAVAGLSTTSLAHDNIIYLNTFRRNNPNAQERGTNQWFSTTANGTKGNYWDDYNEVDRNTDGIGDVPYVISGVSSDDFPTGKFLRPPRKPTVLLPADGADEVGLSVTLSANVTDPDSALLSLFFYDASTDRPLGYQGGIASGKRAYYHFSLPFQTTFAWYCIVNDSKLENRSNISIFTTRQIPPLTQKPIVNTSGPYIGHIGSPLEFDGSTSSDPDGTIIFYRWNFGDGSSEILNEAPVHTYIDPGIYTVTLTVVDNDGRSSMASTTATVSGDLYINSPPAAMYSALGTVTAKSVATLDASNSTDLDGTIVAYRWDFNGDGLFDTTWIGTPFMPYTFSTAGVVNVTLEVKDDADAVGSYTSSISVNAAQTKTPGFELLLVLMGVLVCLLLYKNQRR